MSIEIEDEGRVATLIAELNIIHPQVLRGDKEAEKRDLDITQS